MIFNIQIFYIYSFLYSGAMVLSSSPLLCRESIYKRVSYSGLSIQINESQVKAVVLDPENEFNVDRTLTRQDVRQLVEVK